MWDVGRIYVGTIYEYPLSIEWDIENYFERRPKADAYYQSPKFTFAKSQWRLRLYPNGDSKDNTVGNVELYLEKLHSSIDFHQVSFTMGIKNADDTVYVSQQFTDCLNDRNYMCGTDKIASRSQLFRYRGKLAPKKTLTVYIENLVLTQNLVTDDDDQTSTSSGVENLEEANNKKVDSLTSDIESEGKLKDIDNEIKGCPHSDIIKGEGNSEDILNEMEDSPPSDIEGVELLARNFKDLFLNEEDCDVTFKVDNREFRAHITVLVARSPVFASMFRHDMSEKNTGIVNIPDCGAEAFKELLLYLYSGIVTHSSSDITFELYEASVKYDLEHLKRKCVHFMKDDLSIDTFCDILAISLKHNEMKLVKIATDFFAEHVRDILPTVKWQTFLKENHIAANELLMKAWKTSTAFTN